MQTTATSPVGLELKRNGGAIVTARIDIWSASPQGWNLHTSSVFQKVASKIELQSVKLPQGQYTVVFTCRVEESVNGVYAFAFNVANTALYADQGNVNTTPDPHDAKVYKDQFVLDVV